MGIEDEIRTLFSQGYTPQSIISSHPYKKSTVYKVYRNLSTRQVPLTPPQWQVTVSPPPEARRYLPGSTERYTCTIKNNANLDLYVTNCGLQPEWLSDQWHISPERLLLRPGESHLVRIDFPIPKDVSLGEYELHFGIESQYLGPNNIANVSTIQWAVPFILKVKKPLSGYKLFLSHSVEDIHLVRQIDNYLDCNGIEVFIAEDIGTPGAVLEDKFRTLIQKAHFFLALLTENGVRSNWVIRETNYAHAINKPMLLLKESEAQVTSPREWVEFSRFDPQEIILEKIGQALNQLKRNPSGTPLSPSIQPLILVGIGIFLGVILSQQK